MAVMAVTLGASVLSATPLTYSGNLDPANANELIEISFTTSATANLTIQTTSIVSGGLQAVLWLFDSTGTSQIAKNDPPNDQEAVISLPNFAAGTYELIMSVFDQHYCAANTVCNGVVYGNTGWSYNGGYFSNDTTAYAFSINVDNGTVVQNSEVFDPTPTQAFPINDVPEPGSAALLLIGAGLVVLRKRLV